MMNQVPLKYPRRIDVPRAMVREIGDPLKAGSARVARLGGCDGAGLSPMTWYVDTATF
jgi:hypothetical protein